MLMLYIVGIIHGLFYLNLIPQWASSLMLFEMPAIFIVSGYAYSLYENSMFDGTQHPLSIKAYCSFLATRSTRILVPYAVYAMTCIALIYFLPWLGKGNDYALSDLIVGWMNPANFGEGVSVGRLNSHLWFIPVFLIVTAAMPFVTRFRPFKNPNLLLLVGGVAIAEVAISYAHFPGHDIIKQAVFYLVFSLLGYYMARANQYFSRANFGHVAIVAAILLMVFAVAEGNFRVLNMQLNKFPPNGIFFLFSCLWVSLFLFLSVKVPLFLETFEKLGDGMWLRPFITAGYSIYLWQGIGYTVAIQVGKAAHIPILAVWLLALGISVGLGLLAAPAERVKLNLRVPVPAVSAT
jgi:peptidoglycan/LPS O-acetylase OafA/YrhL